MRPFWHSMASWAETPHGSPRNFLSTAIKISYMSDMCRVGYFVVF